MSAAKHCFDSFALPLGRLCMGLGGVLTFMVRIASVGGAEQQRAKWWLRYVSCRTFLLAGMAADASDECSSFTQFTDR